MVGLNPLSVSRRWTVVTSTLQRLVPQASPELCRVLDGRLGALEPPVRAEIFGPHRFAQHGRSLAQTHLAGRAGWRSGAFFPRLRDNILAPDLTMRGPLFALWESIRLSPNQRNVTLA